MFYVEGLRSEHRKQFYDTTDSVCLFFSLFLSLSLALFFSLLSMAVVAARPLAQKHPPWFCHRQPGADGPCVNQGLWPRGRAVRITENEPCVCWTMALSPVRKQVNGRSEQITLPVYPATCSTPPPYPAPPQPLPNTHPIIQDTPTPQHTQTHTYSYPPPQCWMA